MKHHLPGGRWSARLAGLLCAASSGCYPDTLLPGSYGSPDDAGTASAPASSDTTIAMGPAPAASSAPELDGAASSTPAADAGPTTTVGCDLGGRWIATDREVATGLGAQEAAHAWFYFEIAQTGAAATVTRGLNCGQDVVGISSVSANVSYPKVWPSLLARDLETGRKATISASGSKCSVSFEKRYRVLGATVPFFDDPSQTLPTASEQGTSTTPGWEDWDQDGNPGVTMNVTGLATGQIYIVTRTWNAWSGTIAAGAATFRLADDWNTEQDLLGYNGSSLLTAATSGARDNDASLHFVEFARLAATQATGDDATTCAAIRSLAPKMTPDAAN